MKYYKTLGLYNVIPHFRLNAINVIIIICCKYSLLTKIHNEVNQKIVKKSYNRNYSIYVFIMYVFKQYLCKR